MIYSDPGTQFVAAKSELKNVWSEVDKTAVIRQSAENGLKWIMGPADSLCSFDTFLSSACIVLCMSLMTRFSAACSTLGVMETLLPPWKDLNLKALRITQ